MDLSADTGSAAVVIGLYIIRLQQRNRMKKDFYSMAEQMESGEPGTGKLHLGELRSEELQSEQNEEWGDRIWHLNL